MDTQHNSRETCDAIIVGAGFSGLYQLYCLREKLGMSVQVLEAGAGVGGTWFWNRYPGARCDSESHVYCYTFSEELTAYWNWTERYPGSAEIMEYLNHVADRFDLRRSISFHSRVKSASFNESNNCWEVVDDSGRSYCARYLIMAVGCLSTANIPDIDGLEEFSGKVYHTGQWPEEGVRFEDQRVGQIGTGSTGIQAAPVIARTAEHLTVFQRTANYSVPANNHVLSDEDRCVHKANAAQTRELTRSNANGHGWRNSDRRALETPTADRIAIYEKAWETGGLRFRASFSDLLTSEKANATAAEFIQMKIRGIVHDPDTAASLADIDHPYAAKRPPIDTNYFETFNRNNVELVDLRKTPILKIDRHGILCTETNGTNGTETRLHELDILVFATGYDAITGTLLSMDIRGRGGVKLRDCWSNGPRNYLGLQAPGFPNLFMITGPGSPSVLTNMPAAIEQHVEWISDCLAYIEQHHYSTIESPDTSADNWVSRVEQEADKTLLPKVRHSWYLGANIPGKPAMFMPYAGGLDQYRSICEDVASEDYKGFLLT
ncbi:MAG: flavin-containing monooxygenase [Granulosicoccus sp.]